MLWQRCRFTGCLSVCLLLFMALGPARADLPRVVLDALATAAQNPASLSDGQRALLVMFNRDINRAGMLPENLGGIANPLYQNAQQVFQDVSRPAAANAGRNANANFRVQPSKKTEYMPGTDSDYIYELDPNSANPVGDVRRMQTDYNQGINDYIERAFERDPAVRAALEAEGVRVEPRSDWHKQLDVDFMADPRTVNQSQFEEIARLNNDAYTRREAAEFERISRAKDGTPVTPEIYTAYVEEMQDFMKRKRDKIAKIQAHPELLADPNELADFHRILAQEQKYIERIESTNVHLRTQEGLTGPLSDPTAATYVVTYDEQGKAIIKQRSEGTIARRGAGRRAGDFRTSAAAGSVTINSETRALTELSESMAQAARANPGQWPNAPRDIAKLVDHLSPAAKGELIERIARQAGPEVARQVAESMRNLAPRGLAAQLDSALRRGLGVSEDLSRMGNLRRGFNEAAAAALGGLDNISRVAVSLEVAQAASSLRDWAANILKATDPRTSDEEADACFEKAWVAAQNLTIQGGLGALCEAVPTAGAILLGWTVGYDGTSYILINTETGEEFNRRATDFVDRHMQATGQALDDIAQWLGVDRTEILGIVGLEDEQRQRAIDQANIEAGLREAISSGRVVLRPGVTVKDLVDLLREGDGLGVRERVEPVTPDSAEFVIRTLQDELFALYTLAGELRADVRLLQQELQLARQQQLIANHQLGAAEDLIRKLQLQAMQCDDAAEAPALIQQLSAQAVELGQSTRVGLSDVLVSLRTSDRASQLQLLRQNFEAWRDAAGKVRDLASRAREQNDQLRETITAAQAALSVHAQVNLALEKGTSAARQGISACLRIDEVAARHVERGARFEQRKAQLQGQIERMLLVYSQSPDAVARLETLQQSLAELAADQALAGLLADVAGTREALDLLLEELRARSGGLFDPTACAQQSPQEPAVAAAEQAADLTDLLVAQTGQLIEILLPATAEAVRAADLTAGITDRAPAPPSREPADLSAGITDPRRPGDRVAPPAEEAISESRPANPPRTAPAESGPETPLFAIYAVHAYPSPPQDLSRIAAWRQEVLNPGTFAPQQRALGHLAFRVTGQLRVEYEAHRQRQAQGQTSEDFQWFRPKARYHQILAFENEAGPAKRAPLFLSFVRFEQEEPTWVKQTTIGFQANNGLPGRIETLGDLETRGAWQARIQGQRCSAGPLQFDGDRTWSLETRKLAVAFMKELLTALEDLFRAP